VSDAAQVVTDSAANCKAAGAIIEAKWPHIKWAPCAAHTCDLFLEDVFKMDPFKNIYEQTKLYITFIR
jgi:hypothetical protein